MTLAGEAGWRIPNLWRRSFTRIGGFCRGTACPAGLDHAWSDAERARVFAAAGGGSVVNILLADDDTDMLDVTAYALRREGFTVAVVTDGIQALRRWRANEPDVLILDVGMPRMNGFEVCRRVRQASSVPVIMLTAAADEDHVVQGFQLGVDDYVTKPFSARQLALRVRAVLRRSKRAPSPAHDGALRTGDLTIDGENRRVSQGAREVRLTPLEFRILSLLAANAGRVVSFSRLIEYGWGYDAEDPSMLKTHVCHLRQKLGMRRGQPGNITAVRGVGYSLSPPECEPSGA